MDMPKVSIIIPVFNSERTIIRCLKHCVSQTYKNIEVIVVDDKSEDRSVDQISLFAKDDLRIRLIQLTKNSGVSAARNVALRTATGEFVIFVDSDDFLQNNSVKRMLDAVINEHTDLVIGSWKEKRYFVTVREKKHINQKITKDNIQKEFEDLDKYLSIVWGKIYNAEILRYNDIFFDEGMSIGEDHLFNLKYLSKCSNIMFIDDLIYNYSLGGNLSTTKYHSNISENYSKLLVLYKEIKLNFNLPIDLLRYKLKFFKNCTMHYLVCLDKKNYLLKISECYSKFLSGSALDVSEVLTQSDFSKEEFIELRNKNIKKFVDIFIRRNFLVIYKKRLLRFFRMKHFYKGTKI